MQSIYFALQPMQIAIIHQNIMRLAQALLAFGLGLENGCNLLFADLVALHGALNLQLLWRIHHQDTLGQ